MKPLRISERKKRRRVTSIIPWTALPVCILALLIYSTTMPDRSYSGPLRPLSQEENFLSIRLKTHVSKLAGEIGERNIWHPADLEKSADYINMVWREMGFDVDSQSFTAQGVVVSNLETRKSGSTFPEEIIVVGAHYDSVIGSPGANDNASGVAALLEISRHFANSGCRRTIRFVAFVNEEPPFFQTNLMGSLVYASRSKNLGEQISAMISMETIGYYSDEEGSQAYPFPLTLFYPRTANFIGFVGNMSSRRLVHRVISTFRGHTDFPSQGAAAPGWIAGIGWSDHWSFWQHGYPALMVTDTAPYRYQHYHSGDDTPDKIDYDRMARVVAGIIKVVADLADSPSGL